MLRVYRSGRAVVLALALLFHASAGTSAELVDAPGGVSDPLAAVPELIGTLQLDEARALLDGLTPESLTNAQREVRTFSLGVLDYLDADCAAALPRLESTRASAQLDPRSRAIGHWALGACYLHQAQAERASHLLERALSEGYQASTRQLWRVAAGFAEQGRHEQALAHAERADLAMVEPRAAELRFLAQLYRQTGRTAQAVAALERLVTLTQDRFDRIALGRAVEALALEAAALEARVDR